MAPVQGVDGLRAMDNVIGRRQCEPGASCTWPHHEDIAAMIIDQMTLEPVGDVLAIVAFLVEARGGIELQRLAEGLECDFPVVVQLQEKNVALRLRQRHLGLAWQDNLQRIQLFQ